MPQLLRIVCALLRDTSQIEVIIFKNTHQLDIQQLFGSKQVKGGRKQTATVRRLIMLFYSLAMISKKAISRYCPIKLF